MSRAEETALRSREWICCLVWATILSFGVAVLLVSTPPASEVSKTDRWPPHNERHDDQAYVATLLRSGASERARFIVLGHSSSREAFVSDAELSGQIDDKTSDIFLNLSTSDQAPIEFLFLAETVQPQPGQVIIVFLTETGFRQAETNARLEAGAFLRPPTALLKYPTLIPGYWTYPGAMQWFEVRSQRANLQRQFHHRLRRWAQEILYDRALLRYEIHRYDNAPRPKPAQLDAQAAAIRDGLRRDPAQSIDHQIRILDAFAKFVRQRGATPIFAAAPRHDIEIPETQIHRERFGQALADFLAANNIGWLDLNHEIDWQADDFFDWVHVSAQGRRKWSRAFVEWARGNATTNAQGGL